MKIKFLFSLLAFTLSLYPSLVFSKQNFDSVDVYLKNSKEFSNKFDFNNSLKQNKLALEYALKNKVDKKIGDVFFEYGMIYKKRGLIDSAIYFFELSSLNYETIKEEEKHIESNFQLGKCERINGQYHDALKYFNTALKFYGAKRNYSKLAEVRLNLGNLFKSINKFQTAKENYFQALAIYKSVNEFNKIADCYNNIGNTYRNEKKYDSAFYYMYKTLEIRKKENQPVGLSYIYHNLANIHGELENLDSALYYIHKAVELKYEINNEAEINESFLILSEIYFKKKDINNSIYYANQTYESGIKRKNFELINESSLLLAKNYFHLKDYKKSAEFYHVFDFSRDSINHKIYSPEFESELIQYEFFKDSLLNAKSIVENEKIKFENENIDLSNKITQNRLKFIIIILVLILVFAFIMMFSYLNRMKKYRDFQDQLGIQNNELKKTLISKEEKEVLLKEIHHRVKNNLQIINSLIRLQANFMTPKNFTQKLNETENRIRSMALVHEKLYKSDNLSSLDAKSYIEELAQNVLSSFETEIPVKFDFDIEEKNYNIDTLIPLGLVINEVLSNSIKYAFTDREIGKITIFLQSSSKGVLLKISDNGIGADLSFDELKEDSLGMELIVSLVDQLDGKLQLNTENGFEYIIQFNSLK